MSVLESATVRRVQAALAALGLGHEVVALERSCRTAADAAHAVGCEVGQIAKSLVFRLGHTDRALLVITSGANRVDEAALATLVGEPVRKADADFVRAETGFAIGGVAPVGHTRSPVTLIDQDLLAWPEIWAAAGHPSAVFRLEPEHLVRMTGGRVVAVREPKVTPPSPAAKVEYRPAMPDLDPMRAETLTEVMRRRAAASPAQQYFSVFDETVTYDRLWAQSGRYAAGLARAGVGPGDTLCLIYPTCAEFFYTFFGALRIGAVPVPLYPTLGVEATANIFRDSDAVAVATVGWFRQGVDESVAAAPNVRAVVEPNELDVEAEAPPLHAAQPDDLAFLQYTSGSTGHPRGVMLTHANVVHTCRFMGEAAGLTAEDRVVSWLPLYHDMGLIGCAFTPPLTATPLWLLPPDLRNPRQWLELITRVRATFTVSPDFGYRNCVRHVRDTADLDLSSLKAALSGAEPVRTSTIDAFERHFGLKQIVRPCYGLAEATLAVAIWPRGVPLLADRSGRFLSVGKPCRGVSVRIMEPQAEGEQPEVTLGADVEGEVCVKSPGVMRGYYNNPEATRRVLSPDGWLRTGDLGFVDAEGHLFITGRLKDLIILGGENVLPADVEEVVDHVPGVRYSAAIGIDSERTGTQRLYIVAEVREEAAAADALQRVTRDIVTSVHRSRGHRPARVLLVRAGTIPKTSSGKIQRARLGEMIRAGELAERLVHGEA